MINPYALFSSLSGQITDLGREELAYRSIFSSYRMAISPAIRRKAVNKGILDRIPLSRVNNHLVRYLGSQKSTQYHPLILMVQVKEECEAGVKLVYTKF